MGAEAEAAETACRLETAADGVASEAEALGKGEVPGALQAAAVGGVRGVIERDTVAVVSAGVSGGRHGHDSTADGCDRRRMCCEAGIEASLKSCRGDLFPGRRFS